MKNYLNLLKKTANSGFTLVELIFASMLTIIVVGGAGYGLFVMTRENVASNAASDTQYNLNRAAEFISDEIKASANITADSSLTVPSNCSSGTGNDLGTGTVTPVLGLSVNGSSTTNVIYFMQRPSSTWLGNNAIYRCGPGIDMNGNYTSTALADSRSRLLIDLIASTRSPAETCTNGATPFPAGGTAGFFVCKSGNLAEINIAASALNTQTATGFSATTTSGSRFEDKANYRVITQAYTRASNGVPITISGTTLSFTETARATLQNTSATPANCSSNITINSQTWSTPSTTTSFTLPNTLSPGTLSISPAITTVATTGDNNKVTVTSGTCTYTITLLRA